MKRLVVCCDGTWNRPDQVNRGVAAPTNVAKFALALAERDADRHEQRLHYEAGVGTRRHERLLGGAFGVGLSRNVRECYRFLVDNYEPGDVLYFVGFSRGAFTARSVAGLVRNCGILRREHAHRIDDAYVLYRSPRRDTEPGGLGATLFRRTYSHPDSAIEFVGVWDTVGALGIPVDGFHPPVLSRLWAFHDTRLSRAVRHAYHAVSIDERRAPFKPTLWVKQGDAADQVLEQVWFAGVALRRRRRLSRSVAVGDPPAVDGREGAGLRAGLRAGPFRHIEQRGDPREPAQRRGDRSLAARADRRLADGHLHAATAV